jgi:branched-chain amino acid transport system permease protein
VVLFEVFLNGLLLGGMYGLIALGLNLQFGVARMMNLSYGEFFMAGAFAAYFALMLWKYNPLLSVFVSVPIVFVINWLIYRFMMVPLVRRASDQESLEPDVVLVTFGVMFVLEGLALATWGGEQRGYSFLAFPIDVLGAKISANRLLAFLAACLLAFILFLIFRFRWLGRAFRSVAIDPVAASLVGVNVQNLSALAFAAGGAVAAISGILVSTFISFTPSMGVVFTLKALIVVIVAGVGRMAGSLGAGLLLGVVESLGGYLIDSGLTLAINYALFMLILLIRPTGLFARG